MNSAHKLYETFTKSTDPKVIVNTANEIKQHFAIVSDKEPRDEIGEDFLYIIGGKKETFEWFVLLIILYTNEEKCEEYFTALNNKKNQININQCEWTNLILREIQPKMNDTCISKSINLINDIETLKETLISKQIEKFEKEIRSEKENELLKNEEKHIQDSTPKKWWHFWKQVVHKMFDEELAPVEKIKPEMLIQEVINENISKVKALLDDGIDVNAGIDGGGTALYAASRIGNLEIVKLLLDRGAEVNITDTDGGSVLGVAAQDGHIEIVKILIAKGAKVNTSSNDGVTALLLASQNGYFEVVKELLAKNAKVNVKDSDGATALYMASQNGHTEIVKILLDNGADVNNKIYDGSTPLLQASLKGHTEIVKLLLDKGADYNARYNNGASTIQLASQGGYIDIVKILLAKGINVNKKNERGETALWIASYKGYNDVVKLLLANKADVNAKRNDGVSALMLACQEGHTEVVKSLLEYGVDIISETDTGLNPIKLASDNGHKHIVEILLEYKSDNKLESEESNFFVGSLENLASLAGEGKCPLCGNQMKKDQIGLRCENGHDVICRNALFSEYTTPSEDVARQLRAKGVKVIVLP